MKAKDLLCGNPLHLEFRERKWYGIAYVYRPPGIIGLSGDYGQVIKLGQISSVKYDEGESPLVYFEDNWLRADCVCDSAEEAIDAFIEYESEKLRKSFAGQVIKIEKAQKPKEKKRRKRLLWNKS